MKAESHLHFILLCEHQVGMVSRNCALQQQAFILFYELGPQSGLTPPVVDQTSDVSLDENNNVQLYTRKCIVCLLMQKKIVFGT